MPQILTQIIQITNSFISSFFTLKSNVFHKTHFFLFFPPLLFILLSLKNIPQIYLSILFPPFPLSFSFPPFIPPFPLYYPLFSYITLYSISYILIPIYIIYIIYKNKKNKKKFCESCAHCWRSDRGGGVWQKRESVE